MENHKKYYYINKNKTLEYNENDHISIEYYSNPSKDYQLYNNIFNKSDVFFHYKELFHHLPYIIDKNNTKNNILLLGGTYHDLIHIGSSILENNLKYIKLFKIVEFSDESNKKEIKKSFEKNFKSANYKINHINSKEHIKDHIFDSKIFKNLDKEIDKNKKTKFNTIILHANPRENEKMGKLAYRYTTIF